jgi:hypothetical protein
MSVPFVNPLEGVVGYVGVGHGGGGDDNLMHQKHCRFI